MGIFSGLFKSRDKPENRTAGSTYTFYMGGTTSGKTVTERSAMQMTAVYSCVRILSEAVAGLPLHLYRYKEDGGKEKALDHPLYRLLHDEPNPEMSSFVFRETLMTHLLLWGNAYVTITGSGSAVIRSLPCRSYTVEQVNDWSWRYGDGRQTAVVTEDGVSVTFGGEAVQDRWLSGSSAAIRNRKG